MLNILQSLIPFSCLRSKASHSYLSIKTTKRYKQVSTGRQPLSKTSFIPVHFLHKTLKDFMCDFH